MFGVSIPELFIVFVIVLLVLGPDKLPKAAKTLGNLLGALRNQSDAIRRDFYNSVYPPAEDLQKTIKETKRDLRAVAQELGGEQYLTCEEQEELRREQDEEPTQETDKKETSAKELGEDE